MATLIILIAVGCAVVYGALIRYVVVSWRSVQPQSPFSRQGRWVIPGAILYSLIWIIGMFVVTGPATMLSLYGSPDWDVFLDIVTFIPSIPYSAYFLTGVLVNGYEWGGGNITLLNAIRITGAIASISMILVLIVFVEWLISSMIYRRSLRSGS